MVSNERKEIVKKFNLSMVLIFVLTTATSLASHKDAAGTKKFTRPYGMAGCGRGSLIIDKSGSQIFAATTNAVSGSQVFGITNGTSNCLDDPNDEVASRMDRFVTTNKVAMAGDIARGSGETISSISQLMDCKNVDLIGSTLQKNFKEIFPSYKISPNEVTDSIISVIKEDRNLTFQCKSIS